VAGRSAAASGSGHRNRDLLFVFLLHVEQASPLDNDLVLLREQLRAPDEFVHLGDQALGFGLQLSVEVLRLGIDDAHAENLRRRV